MLHKMSTVRGGFNLVTYYDVNYKTGEIEERFEKIPYLFHYTSVDTFVQIIKNKSLKFNRNDFVNDRIEGVRTGDAKYYMSCFSYNKKESIPMWFIYSRGTHYNLKRSGIRLQIKNSKFFTNNAYYLNEKNEKVYYEVEELGGIYRGIVYYDNDKENVGRSPISGPVTNVFQMALCKSDAWDYEHEARCFIYPSQQENIKEFYIEFDDSFFADLKINFSPFMSTQKTNSSKKLISDLLGSRVVYNESELKDYIQLVEQKKASIK